MEISGATHPAAVIGDPIRHSRSPEIFNAALAGFYRSTAETARIRATEGAT